MNKWQWSSKHIQKKHYRFSVSNIDCSVNGRCVHRSEKETMVPALINYPKNCHNFPQSFKIQMV